MRLNKNPHHKQMVLVFPSGKGFTQSQQVEYWNSLQLNQSR
jgi:hypothetical protein